MTMCIHYIQCESYFLARFFFSYELREHFPTEIRVGMASGRRLTVAETGIDRIKKERIVMLVINHLHIKFVRVFASAILLYQFSHGECVMYRTF